ncbi:homoserine kinase type II (protein kinase fold) [Leucothrix sargassi]|nr:homoserine kinase type II (protein kinase fold) [Leucothrix sargassi]
MIEQQYSYSRLMPQSVSELVASNYDLTEIVSCVFYVFGLHDNYLLGTKSERFIVRIYRGSWRSLEDINFELDLLNFLKEKQQPVSAPLLTKNGCISFELDCPEGKRHGAVFSYAEGQPPDSNATAEQFTLLGRTVAMLHNDTENFRSPFKKDSLDLEHLVDRSLLVIKPYLSCSQCDFLASVALTLKNNLEELDSEKLSQVVCIGDVNMTNFHLTEDSKITLFDFDQCGYGQRAFEIGKFFSSIKPEHKKAQVKQAFLKGYESVCALSESERRAVPYYELASVIWVMSIRVDNAEKVGHSALEAAFWCKRIGVLEAMMTEVTK